MEELLSKQPVSSREEITELLAHAILRSYYRQYPKSTTFPEKDSVRLDIPANSCMTVNTAEKNDGD
ncbi:hypothetical protein [Endozoicomonas numazuensis]|uniref:Uncharacterized protein n=1 Tax=Endozoicomonas numazuensis TaxID=1137799 RepID=A0A081NFD1_9GAMM|nr:hypothetical protein [Endozoicomonas numazuensis]KEQ17154.1 hypothetical protein GZ78_14945 [Endozoicomonas numazuensis]